MPVIYNEYENTYRLAVWSLSEPLAFFEEKSQLSLSDKKYYQSISNTSRKREWLAVRLLLHDILGFWPQISYTETGKPILQNHSRHLSVSHAKSMVGILLSTNPHAGIDIEPTNRNVEKVAKRFLSEQELADIEKSKLDYSRILYWCAKEAIFKSVNENNIQFSKQILISEVSENGTMKGKFVSSIEQVELDMNFIELENHLVVWTT